MFEVPVNAPATPNIVWALHPHFGGFGKLFCHPQTVDKVMELGSLSKIGEYYGLVHGNPPVPPEGFEHCQTDGLKAPVAIFKGLKRPMHYGHPAADGDVYIYVTNPEFTWGYHNSSHGDALLRAPKPIESVFTTYVSYESAHVDAASSSMRNNGKFDGLVLFWEWTESARNEPHLPHDFEKRYAMRIR